MHSTYPHSPSLALRLRQITHLLIIRDHPTYKARHATSHPLPKSTYQLHRQISISPTPRFSTGRGDGSPLPQHHIVTYRHHLHLFHPHSDHTFVNTNIRSIHQCQRFHHHRLLCRHRNRRHHLLYLHRQYH